MHIDFNQLRINKLNPTTDFEKKTTFFIKDWFSQTKQVKVQTSGSTGTPKTFFIDKDKMMNSANMTIKFLNLKVNDTALLCLPIEYVSGKMMLVRSIQQKMKIEICNPSIQPLASIEKEIDFCAMTPLQVENSLEKIHLIKKLIIGGASVSEKLKEKIHLHLKKDKKTNHQVYETYGMSETLSHIALKEIYPNKENYFRALENINISQDDRGCMIIDAPILHPNKLYTNDIVDLQNKNEFKFIGRADNVINSGGAKIFPEELEAIVKTKIEHEVVFIGVKDDYLGERLTLIIEGANNKSLIDQINQISFQKKYHHPKSILFVKELPRTKNGKIDRLALKKQIHNTQV